MDRRALFIAFRLGFLLDVARLWACPIYDATRSGDAERIWQLVEQGADVEIYMYLTAAP